MGFLVGDIFSKEVDNLSQFDLIVANEVLYYMNNMPVILRRTRIISCSNFVTYFSGEMARMDPQILSFPDVDSEIMVFEDARWPAAWWRCNLI